MNDNNNQEMELVGSVFNFYKIVNQSINQALSFDLKLSESYNKSRKTYKLYCTFDLNNEFIVYKHNHDREVSDNIFGHKIKLYRYCKNGKLAKLFNFISWRNKINYNVLENVKFIEISKYDKLYLLANKYICEWNIQTKEICIIFKNNKNKDDEVMKYIKIICLKLFNN
jgi:hypothetical protein